MRVGTRGLPASLRLTEQLPLCAVSLVLAELFYKLHSFTLEFLAFACTWWLLATGVSRVRVWRRSES